MGYRVMYQQLPQGLRLIIGLDCLAALLFLVMFLGCIFLAFYMKIPLVGLLWPLFISGSFCVGFLQIAVHGMKLEARTIKEHDWVSTFFFLGAGGVLVFFLTTLAGHPTRHKLIDIFTLFSYGFAVLFLVGCAIFIPVYLRSKKVKAILVN